MYLEISNVAAALGKNPYEPREKILLTSWARHCPKNVLDYLIKNKCIINLEKGEDTFSENQKQTYTKIISTVDKQDFDVKDFSKVENHIVQEYKKSRNNEQSDTEVKQLIKYTQDNLKKDNGNIQENNIITKEKFKRGNDKMYYYTIQEDCQIGGKHDASDKELLLEIKTRVRKQNVRRNEYDLYQLIGYLLSTNTTKGKIVQIYNKQKYDSDDASEIEYGLVDITIEPWNQIAYDIKENLKSYFDDLKILIDTQNYKYLDKTIPKALRPIAKINTDTSKLCEEHVKFNNILRFL